jgi:hypothetical protein
MDHTELRRNIMALSYEQKAAFWRDGFLAIPRLLSQEEVAALKRRAEQIILGEVPFPRDLISNEPTIPEDTIESVPPFYRVRKIYNLTRLDPVFQEYARHPRIVAVICDLLGPDIKLYVDQMLLKPPRFGTAKPYHQDSAYFPIEPQELVTCWLAMDDATMENGCMRYLPGSHRQGPVEHHQLKGPHIVPEGFDEFTQHPDEVCVELEAGGCIFHHSLSLHASQPNQSPNPRGAMTTCYMRATSRYTGKEPKPDYLQIAGDSYPGCV